jgi:hypothetical protein
MMPLSASVRTTDDGDMHTTHAGFEASQETAGRVVVYRREGTLTARLVRRRDLILTHLLSHSLDGELAAGQPPEDRWLRAVRANVLAAPATRRELAVNWRRLVARTRMTHSMTLGPVLARGVQTAEANELVDQLADRLSATAPVPVRGVALALGLLTDGAGPVYRPQSPEHALAALAEVIRALTPSDDVTRPG